MKKDERKTRAQLISELDDMRRRIAELKASEDKHKQDEERLSRNKASSQTLKVREIALGIESRTTLNDVLSFVVESARDITGIRFVLVQRVDESGRYVITPYYSKVRDEGIIKLLRAVGFDIDEYLGKYSTSGKLQFEVAKLKVAQDYLRNPRIITMKRLSELLDGIWPRILCDSIQKILYVEQFVITPLLIEGSSWGNLLFFLDAPVPQSTLEMITAHCALGIKNVLAIENLRQSEEKFRNLVENAPVGIALTSPSGEILDMNRALLKMHGYDSKEEFNKIPVSERYYDLNDRKQWLKLVQEQGRVEGFEVQLKRKDGTFFWASFNAIPYAAESGPQLFINVIQDITDSKGAREALRESEQKYHNLFNSIPDACCWAEIVLDEGNKPVDYRILEANEAWGKVNGVDVKKIIGRTRREILPITDLSWIETYGKVALTGEADSFERYSAVNDKWLHVSIYSPGDRQFVSILSDITERKQLEQALRQSEQKLRLMFDSLSQGVSVTSLDGKITEVNEAKTFMHGYADKKDLIGRNVSEIISLKDRDRAQQNRRKVLEDGLVSNVEFTYLTRDGKEFPVEVSIAVLRDSTGNPIGLITISENITERKRTEQALIASETRYRRLFESAKDGILIINAETGLIIDVNPFLIDLLGFTKEEFLGKALWEIGIFQDIVANKANFEELRQKGYMRYEDLPLKTSDRRQIAVEFVSNVYDVDHQKVIQCNIRNITERKRIEERLRATEQNFKNSMDDSPLGILIDTIDNEHLYANKALLDIYGFSSVEEFNAVPAIERLTPVSYAEHLQRRELRKEGKPVPSSYEISIIRKDGEIRHLSASRKEVQWNGKTQLQIVFQDITEHKKAEEVLRLQAELLDMESDSVDLHDSEGNILYANKAFYDTLGYTKEELSNMNIHELDDRESREQVPARLKEIAEKGKVTFNVSHRHNNGAWIPLEVHASAIELGGRKLIISVAHDITETRKMQEQLMAQDRLVSIGQLVAGVAHEINNPLTSIVGFSDLLLQNDLPADIKNDLQIINHEALRTTKIVQNLLTFARKQPEGKTEILINDQLERVLDIRNHEQVVNNIRVSTRFAPELPQIMGNSSQLQQVFFNLVINAEQSMLGAHNGGTLTISTEQWGDSVRVSIADDGPGISPESMNRLFTPFFTTKEVGKGTGLGLSICHGIVTEHGGKIYAESEPGKGAKFIIELPVTKPV